MWLSNAANLALSAHAFPRGQRGLGEGSDLTAPPSAVGAGEFALLVVVCAMLVA